ncbi:MAG: SusC/RagA family TonB-linked outer membrane protein [Saprospiraceae bacterium]
MKLKLTPYLRSALLLLGLLVGLQTAYAQRTVSGTVTDNESGETLIGASVLAVGTTTGTITDFDGNFELAVPAGVEQLEFSYTGYTTQTIDIAGRSVIDLQMQAGSQLEEVVVIGYGTVKRQDATGSVETVTAETFNKGAITSPQELISGKIAGVQITTDGTPGGGSTIRIRGGSSLSASNDPLIVIDGVPLASDGISGSRNPLNVINPNDIETFTVLKDASATAIYGSRASNGVIIITTKKGTVGKKVGVSYNGSVGFSRRADELDVLDGDAFRKLITDRFGEGSTQANLLGTANTDFQEEIFQTGVTHDHNVSAAGSVGIVPYRVTLGFTNRTGILKRDEFRRLTYGVNLTPGFFDNRLQFNASIKGSNNINFFANQGAIGAALAFDPTQPVFSGNDAFGGYFTTLQSNGNPNNLAPANPLALLEQRDDESGVNRYIMSLSTDYRFGFLPELRANLNVAYDESNSSGMIFVPLDAAFAFDPTGQGGTMNNYTQEKTNQLLEFYLNYTKDFGGFRADILGGYSWQNFFLENYSFNSNITGTETNENRDPSEYYLISLFGRVNLGIGERLNLTGTIRRDGSSRFSEDNRYGLFPSAAAAYNVVNQEGNKKGVNRLKLRVGYGVTGQQEVGGYYPSQAVYLASQPNARYQFGDQYITTLRPEGYNAGLKWEETSTLNFAVDFGIFDDRIFGSVEVYQRETTDLLNFIPVPAGTNLTNFINSNVGDLENQGFEVALTVVPYRTENASWSIGGNVTVNRNEITRLTATEDPNYQGVATGGIAGGVGNTIQINSVGFPARSFYVFEQVYDETGSPVEGVYVDRNGDGQVTPDDRYRLEDPAPDAFVGFTSNFDYGNFDFSFAGRANFGNYIYNNNLSQLATYNQIFGSTGFLANTLPDITAVDFNNSQYFSDLYVQDGSFLRLDHITAGYRFGGVFGENSNLRVYATVQNPVLITKYDGLDPEVFGGIDNNIYPRSTTYLFGLSANF